MAEMLEETMTEKTQELVSDALKSFNDPAEELRHLLGPDDSPITISMAGW